MKTFLKSYLTLFMKLFFNMVFYRTRGRYFLGVIASNDRKEVVAFTHLDITSYGHFRSASYGIVVREDYQGKGLGKALTDYIIRLAMAIHLNKIVLTVNADNQRAIKLYEKFGFTVEGLHKREGVWRDLVLDVYHMALHLQ